MLAAILVIWIAATLFLSPAYADAIPFSMQLRSRLLADYDPDDGKSLFAALRLSILSDTLRDQGLSQEEAEQQRLAIEASLDDPVPTATAFDFDGSDPYTATPTDTAIPTDTPTPTATSTNTPRPTATKTSTPKPKPTNTPKPPTAISDTSAPQIKSWVFTPTPGPGLDRCDIQLSVDVLDPAFSTGVSIVEAKHSLPGTPGSYNFFTFSGSGSFVAGPSSDWTGTFSGTILISQVNALEAFDVYFKVKDSAGNLSGWSGPYSYTMDATTNCP